MADDPHFGKVVNAFPATKQLALRHRRARKAPAGAGLRLILHRRHGHQHFIGKYIGSGILSVLLGLFRRIFRTGDIIGKTKIPSDFPDISKDNLEK